MCDELEHVIASFCHFQEVGLDDAHRRLHLLHRIILTSTGSGKVRGLIAFRSLEDHPPRNDIEPVFAIISYPFGIRHLMPSLSGSVDTPLYPKCLDSDWGLTSHARDRLFVDDRWLYAPFARI